MSKLPVLILISVTAVNGKLKRHETAGSPLDHYIEQALKGAPAVAESSPGSLYARTGLLADGFRDLRASGVYDLVTILVADKASAVSSRVSNTSRKSRAKA